MVTNQFAISPKQIPENQIHKKMCHFQCLLTNPFFFNIEIYNPMLYITGSCHMSERSMIIFSKLFETEISFKTEKITFFLLKLVHMSLRLQQGLRFATNHLINCSLH